MCLPSVCGLLRADAVYIVGAHMFVYVCIYLGRNGSLSKGGNNTLLPWPVPSQSAEMHALPEVELGINLEEWAGG